MADVVQANLLAATAALPDGERVFNVGAGRSTSLADLFAILRDAAAELRPQARFAVAHHAPPRPGDVRDSRADVSRIVAALGYHPAADLRAALRDTVRRHADRPRAARPVAARSGGAPPRSPDRACLAVRERSR